MSVRSRAEQLEVELARTLRSLDGDALARFAETALRSGIVDDDELAEIFDRAIGGKLEDAYQTFSRDTSTTHQIPLSRTVVAREADQAVDQVIIGLATEAGEVVERLVKQAMREGWSVQKLAGRIRENIGLTVQQSRTVERFEQRLRSAPASALRAQLRDRRFDARLARGDKLSESDIERMTTRYRERWHRHRSLLIARTELLRASNAAYLGSFIEAEDSGFLPYGTRKYWHNVGDSHVRHSHVEVPRMNAEGVPLKGTFVTPLGTLRYPLDPQGLPADTIGCRCYLTINTTPPGQAR